MVGADGEIGWPLDVGIFGIGGPEDVGPTTGDADEDGASAG